TRRLNRLLTLTQGPEQVPGLAATLAATLTATLAPTVPDPGHGAGGEYPPPPPAARDWASDIARVMAGDLGAAGYAVHGNLDDLQPDRPSDRSHDRPPKRGVHPDDTLELALTACLRAWLLQGGT
ncbi:MAG: hypothetical protein ABIN79_11170, partial [Marmoricola sp.]